MPSEPERPRPVRPPSRREGSRPDAAHGRGLLVAAAAATVLLALGLLVRLAVDGHAEEPPARVFVSEPAPPASSPRELTARPVDRASHAADETGRAPSASGAEPPEGEDAPFSFGTPGERSGIQLFPPPGTMPLRGGIVVPEDFELPPGYVRHYQNTDDGERLPAILMFSPDYEWVDETGAVIALPDDGIVPPEMAPPGLAIQMLVVPEAGTGAEAKP
ncbi:hypothetical protein MYXO_02197 [Myxococcaceae bacterium]|nr:hypothetical protein MYXO_02197 [Myxococcaceae bacterium]